MFALVMGTPSLVYANRVNNMNLFFLTGLPGGLIYVLLCLRKCGLCLSWDEPLLSCCINVLLRAPGILWSCACLVISGGVGLPSWVMGLQLGLSSANAIGYAHLSYTRCRMYRRSAARSLRRLI